VRRYLHVGVSGPLEGGIGTVRPDGPDSLVFSDNAAPARARHARKVDLSPCKHIAHRFGVPPRAAGRGNPTCVQGLRDLVQ
jgi:hypothetical protein